MAENNGPGSFGTNQGRVVIDEPQPRKPRQIGGRTNRTGNLGDALSNISGERWVDIICLSIIGVFLLVVAINWQAFSSALFHNFLFPIIVFGAKALAAIAVVMIIVAVISGWFRRRFWWM